MIREIVNINENLCDGCGLCIPSCEEGALRIVDGKARLISDLMCDGLGACLGYCPQGAITIEKREAGSYDETRVMELMMEKGENTVVAHLRHLKEHQELEFLQEGIVCLNKQAGEYGLDVQKILGRVHGAMVEKEQLACGCAGSEARSFIPRSVAVQAKPSAARSGGERAPAARSGADHLTGPQPAAGHRFSADPARAHPSSPGHLSRGDRSNGNPSATGGTNGDPSATGRANGDPSAAGGPFDEPHTKPSELRHWPVQMHLINPAASCYRGADMLLAADCVAYSLGDFHSRWLGGKSLAIACPKLDSGTESYVLKLKSLIEEAKINTLTVLIMQVPCCGGLMRMVLEAVSGCSRKVPVKQVIVGVEGEILREEWI